MKTRVSIYDCYVIELNKIHMREGNITIIEDKLQLPFKIRRIYYLYDVPSGATRAGHAHKEMHCFMVAASGAFDVVLDDGNNKKVIELNRPNYGLYVPPGIWRELINFSAGSISLNLVSERYDEKDYIRDYDKFLLFKNENSSNI